MIHIWGFMRKIYKLIQYLFTKVQKYKCTQKCKEKGGGDYCTSVMKGGKGFIHVLFPVHNYDPLGPLG